MIVSDGVSPSPKGGSRLGPFLNPPLITTNQLNLTLTLTLLSARIGEHSTKYGNSLETMLFHRFFYFALSLSCIGTWSRRFFRGKVHLLPKWLMAAKSAGVAFKYKMAE